MQIARLSKQPSFFFKKKEKKRENSAIFKLQSVNRLNYSHRAGLHLPGKCLSECVFVCVCVCVHVWGMQGCCSDSNTLWNSQRH